VVVAACGETFRRIEKNILRTAKVSANGMVQGWIKLVSKFGKITDIWK
jgi:hypothetical protein